MERILRVVAAASTLGVCGALFGFSSLFDGFAMTSQGTIAAVAGVAGALLGAAIAASVTDGPHWAWTALAMLVMYAFLMIDDGHRQYALGWFLAALVVGAAPIAVTLVAQSWGSTGAAASLTIFGAGFVCVGLGLGILLYPLMLVPYGLWLLSAGRQVRRPRFTW